MKKILTSFSNVLFAVANFFLFGALSRRRARSAQLARANALLGKEWKRISLLRSFRRALHLSTIWKAINEHPGTKHLPRRVRRAAAREAAKHAFRMEKNPPLPEIRSRGHQRRLRRGYFDPSLLMPVRAEGGSTATASV